MIESLACLHVAIARNMDWQGCDHAMKLREKSFFDSIFRPSQVKFFHFYIASSSSPIHGTRVQVQLTVWEAESYSPSPSHNFQ